MSQGNDTAVKECDTAVEEEELTSDEESETESVSEDYDMQILRQVHAERNSSSRTDGGVIRHTGNLEIGKYIKNRSTKGKMGFEMTEERWVSLAKSGLNKEIEAANGMPMENIHPSCSMSSSSKPDLNNDYSGYHKVRGHEWCGDYGQLVITKTDADGTSTTPLIFQPAETPFNIPHFSTGFKKVLKRKASDGGEEENKEEPLPISNIEIDLDGGRQGIEWNNNSCYMDATLFCMLYGTTVFDSRFFELKHCLNPGDWTSVRTAYALKRIASLLRCVGFCPSSETTRLREVVSKVNPKLKDSMMDVDEFLQTLLGRALKLKPFINYNVGSNNFLHQIVVDPNEPVMFEVKDMLIKSMELQNLKFSAIPVPALIVKMPVSGGVPSFRSVLPNLTLNVKNLMDNPKENDGEMYDMYLMAVITLNEKHFTAFVRQFNLDGPYDEENWVFFDSMQSKIIPQSWFTSYLRTTELKIERKYHEPCYETRKMLDMMRDCYVCIYFSPSAVQLEEDPLYSTFTDS